MFSKSQIRDSLAKIPAPRDSVVLVHTSLRAVGETEDRGEGFLDALIEYFTAEGGLLCIPTHTWGSIDNIPEPTLDMSSNKTCIGTLPSIAALHPMAHRSMHPTHSMSVFDGKTKAGEAGAAEDFIAGEIDVDTSTSPKGCYGKLYDRNGYVLLVGVAHNRDTYLHSVEERLNVPNRLSEEPIDTKIRLRSGEIIDRPIHCHSARGIRDVSANYTKYEPAFRAHGAIIDGKVGNASVQLCSAVKMAQVVELVRLRSGGIELMSDNTPLKEEWYI